MSGSGMLNISQLSTKYKIKKMGEEDISRILNLEYGNPLYFAYCPPKPCRETVLNDLKALPEGKSLEDKFYIGFFENDSLIATMDFILSFPKEDTIFIGLFMMDSKESGKGKGSDIIAEAFTAWKSEGYKKVRLAYMKGNMQSRNFWRKCGFTETGVEKENEHGMAVIMECNCLQFPEFPLEERIEVSSYHMT